MNNVVCHFSPLHSEEDTILKDGDIVKIDLGIHIDGFIAGLAHTVVVGASKENKITGRKADVLLAAYYAAEIAQRLVKPGNSVSLSHLFWTLVLEGFYVISMQPTK